MEKHTTVFRDEAVDALRLHPDSTIVDATVGSGGHTQHIMSKLGRAGRFIGIDADKTAIEQISIPQSKATTHLVTGNFRNLGTHLAALGIETVDGILADLGWRMEQFSGSGKGFSFNLDEPLIMTYGEPGTYPFTAEDIVNEWRTEDIGNVIKGYGEERYSWKIAGAITTAREKKRIVSSVELAEIIFNAVPCSYRHGRTHPATKTFQALRIAVNDELDALREFIAEAVIHLAPHGRLAIITFHSLEDRIVKHAFKEYALEGVATVITKRPIVPTDDELKQNKRSRSAKLRILEKNE